MDATVNPTLQLQNAVHRLNLWLANSSDAAVWRRNLLLNLLDAQSARGERADIATLSKIEARFSGSNEGLDKPVFRDVRDALNAQIKQLSEMQLSGYANLYDVTNAVKLARSQYRPITTSMMGQQRARAVYDLDSLKKHYRKTMRSRKRANLFYDMRLDPAIEFLNDLEFEVPPEISVGKMDSMIKSVKKQLDSIEEQIDAMPVTPQPDDEANEAEEGEQDDDIKDGDDNQENTVEPALQIYPLEFGPIPDEDGPSLEELERRKKNIEAQLKVLTDQRSEILKKDRPRLIRIGKEFGQLREFVSNFAALEDTQNDPYFIAAQTSLEQFLKTFRYGNDDNLQEKFLLRLKELEENLVKIRGSDAREASALLGESLSWLENANQVSPLVAALRAKYSLPNLYVAVSGKLVQQLGSQSFSQSSPVRQNFKGRLVRGNSRIDGHVNLNLRDDPNQIHVDVNLSGSLAASTYVQQRKLQIFSETSGCLSAQRSLLANIGGLFASEPNVDVRVQTNLNGTTSKWDLVNRIAAKKFAESKADAEAETTQQTKEQLSSQFTDQTDAAVVAGQDALAQAQDVLASNARLAPEMYLRSTPTQIVLIGKKSSPSALASPDYPAHSSIPTDVSVRIHESVLSNFFERTFSGKTFSNEELAEMGEVFGGEAPAALKKAEKPEGDRGDAEDDDEVEDESFSITFSTIRPIQFEFDDSAFGIAISGVRFLQGDKKINTGLKIGLRFKIKQINGKLKLVRDGKAELDYVTVGDKKKDAKAIAFRSFLNGKLNPKDGGEQISVDLPDNLLPLGQLEGLKDNKLAQGMTLVQCRAEKGWLYLGWNYSPEYLSVQHLVDMPAIWTEAVISTLNDVYIESSNPPGIPMTIFPNQGQIIPFEAQPIPMDSQIIPIEGQIDGQVVPLAQPAINLPLTPIGVPLNSPQVLPGSFEGAWNR